MAERMVKLADSADRELVRAAREMGMAPEVVAQDAIETWLREKRERSLRFDEVRRAVERKLGGG